jgi:hypothetical protein
MIWPFSRVGVKRPEIKIIHDDVVVDALREWGNGASLGAIRMSFPEHLQSALMKRMGALAAQYQPQVFDPKSSFEAARCDLEARRRFATAVCENYRFGKKYIPFDYSKLLSAIWRDVAV